MAKLYCGFSENGAEQDSAHSARKRESAHQSHSSQSFLCSVNHMSFWDSVNRLGERLLCCMQYDGGMADHMAYKSDAQTMRGTAATGQRTNHMYRIHIRQPSQPKAA